MKIKDKPRVRIYPPETEHCEALMRREPHTIEAVIDCWAFEDEDCEGGFARYGKTLRGTDVELFEDLGDDEWYAIELTPELVDEND